MVGATGSLENDVDEMTGTSVARDRTANDAAERARPADASEAILDSVVWLP